MALNIFNAVKNVIFNRKLTCNICGRENFNGEYFCDDCKKTVVKNDGYICDHCGAPLDYPAAYCDVCADKNLSFAFMRSAYIYTGGIKRVIKNLKYGGKRYLADILAADIYDLYSKTGYNADIATFVPMTKGREKKRGYNQSRELAKAFCALSGVPFADNAIIKKEGVVSQVGLTRNARLNNLRDSFKVVDKAIFKGKKVIIIDDVATTGSTAETLSAAIMRAGAEEAVVFTAAVTASVSRGDDGK